MMTRTALRRRTPLKRGAWNRRTRTGLLRTRSQQPHKKLEAALDALWSHLVKRRDGGRCLVCGSSFKPEAHHVHKRRFTGTRWVEDNGQTLCGGPGGCHAKAEKGLLADRAMLRSRVGSERYDELAFLANQRTPRTMAFMERAMATLQRSITT